MNTKRIALAGVALAVLGLVLAACGGGSSSSGQPLSVTIHAKDIQFDTTSITAKVGQQVNVTYINDGALDHSFVIDGLVAEQTVAPGKTITFSFAPTAAGTLVFYCGIPGHKDAGMHGQLTVTP